MKPKLRTFRFTPPEVDLEGLSSDFYSEDVQRIRGIMEAEGCTAPATDIYMAWSEYSSSLCASWLYLPEEDKDVLKCIEPYLTEEV